MFNIFFIYSMFFWQIPEDSYSNRESFTMFDYHKFDSKTETTWNERRIPEDSYSYKTIWNKQIVKNIKKSWRSLFEHIKVRTIRYNSVQFRNIWIQWIAEYHKILTLINYWQNKYMNSQNPRRFSVEQIQFLYHFARYCNIRTLWIR